MANNPKSLIEYFYDWEKHKSDEVFMRQPKGKKWKNYTWGETGEQARKIASFIKGLGLPEKSHIAILSKNCAHWIIADIAIMLSGHISVPLYPNMAGDELSYVLEHSECKAIFLGKLDEWESRKDKLSKDIISISFPHYEGNAIVKGNHHWSTIIEKNEPLSESIIPNLDDLFTILYTSGTTGTPKGVMHTWYSTASLLQNEIKYDNLKTQGDQIRLFSYLPLNHIAERIFVEAMAFYRGATISFAESIDTFANNLASVQPTHFIAVPRIWTRFQMAILEKLGEKRLKRMLKTPVLKGIIKSRIQKALGLKKARVLITGAAPMPVGTLNWYKELGLNIQEVYGMTENNGGCCLMPKHGIKNGTIGKPLKGVEIKIDPETSEIITNAPWLMIGYYKDPEQSAKVLEGGWLHTGDMGEIDEDGYVKLTGRVKDTFKTAKGKFIVPAPLEYHFLVNTDVEQACVVGSILPQPIIICVLSEIGKDKDKEEVKKRLLQNLSDTNTGIPNYSRLGKVIVVEDEWSLESGLLTPTMKIKRSVLDRHYQEQYNNWYSNDGLIVWNS